MVAPEVVRYFCQREWAEHLDDVMFRRTGWRFYHDEHAEISRHVAEMMAAELGWDRRRVAAELVRYDQFARETSVDDERHSIRLFSDTPAAERGPSLIVAHRGASADAPENTLAAFQLAWKQGADGIEGDFFLTRDGHVVCIHDETTERLAGVGRSVVDSTLEELRALDVGRWKGEAWRGERIPTLDEVLATVPAGKWVFLELKGGPAIAAPLAAILKRWSAGLEKVVLISFHEETLRECKRRLPDVKIHWLAAYERDRSTDGWHPNAREVIATLDRLGADGFGSESRPAVFDAPFIAALRAAGHGEFHVWTVDDEATARFYAEQGALGLTTNRPAALRAELAGPSAERGSPSLRVISS